MHVVLIKHPFIRLTGPSDYGDISKSFLTEQLNVLRNTVVINIINKLTFELILVPGIGTQWFPVLVSR